MNLIRVIAIFALILIVLKSVSVAQLSDTQVKDRLDIVLKQLPSKVKADPTGRSAQVFVNRERLIDGTIQPYFYGIPGALHETSPAREDRVNQVESWLEPHALSLLTVAKASANSSEIPNAAVSLLAFAQPTPTLRDALLAIARDPETNTQKASEAYNAVFMLELDDVGIRKEVLDILASRNELHTRADLAGELLQFASSRWAMTELQDLYHSFLSVSCKPENFPKRGGRAKLLAQYNIAIRGLKAFGVLGASFGDLLRARLAEMDPAEDADLINSCKETILIIEGGCNPMPMVTWKGRFIGVSKQAYPAWVEGNQGTTTTSTE